MKLEKGRNKLKKQKPDIEIGEDDLIKYRQNTFIDKDTNF